MHIPCKTGKVLVAVGLCSFGGTKNILVDAFRGTIKNKFTLAQCLLL